MNKELERFSGTPKLNNLKNSKGMSYPEFRKSLHVKLPVLILDAIIPWMMIGLMMLFLTYFQSERYLSFLFPLFAAWFCYWLHAYIVLIHEAAHYNIFPQKKINDLISNIVLTPFVGMWVKYYRVTHWKHHMFLGTHKDTEVSYQNPITIKHSVECLTGIFQLKIVLKYLNNFTKSAKRSNSPASFHFITSLAVMLITQVTISLILLFYISVTAAISWSFCVFILIPFVFSLRQTLEHRSFSAIKTVDYSKVVHGPVNRMFGKDLFSKYFGGAGFNRHLLHHYDPTISYTCFDQLEEFLLDTKLFKELEESRTTYLTAFKLLLKQQ